MQGFESLSRYWIKELKNAKQYISWLGAKRFFPDRWFMPREDEHSAFRELIIHIGIIYSDGCVILNLFLCEVPSSPANNRELKHARFRDTDGNRKWAFFTLNLLSHNHIHITKNLFSIRDKWYKNLGDNTVLTRKMFSSGCRPRVKNVRA